jgi:uncharacterized membrane protein
MKNIVPANDAMALATNQIQSVHESVALVVHAKKVMFEMKLVFACHSANAQRRNQPTS